MNYQARQLAKPWGLLGRWILAPLWNWRNAALNEAAFARLGLAPGSRVLEVGFGGGYLLERARRCVTSGRVMGADHSIEMARFCARKFARGTNPPVGLALATVEKLPYANGVFDRVVSVNSIFYWPDPAQGITELGRVTAPGGRVVLVFTSRESLQKRSFARRGVGLYEPGQVETWLCGAGFRDVTVEEASDRRRVFWVVTGTHE